MVLLYKGGFIFKYYLPAIAILAPLLLGIFIYTLRPVPPIILIWMEAFGFAEWLANLRDSTNGAYNHLPGWVIYSLPNGLWIYSYTVIITYIWGPTERSLSRIFWLLSSVFLGLGYEVLQLTPLIPGVFCINDLLFVSCGVILGFIIAKLLLIGRN